MQSRQREFSKVSKMQLTRDESRWVLILDKDIVKSMTVSILVLAALGIWIFMAYKYNLYIKEALICSAIIVGVLFSRATDQSRYLNHEK